MIPVFAQFPTVDIAQVNTVLLGGLCILGGIALWRTAFPAKVPPPEVDAALIEQRLKTLEEKDKADIASRKTMHNDLTSVSQEMKLLTEKLASIRDSIPTMAKIREEIDRSIKAGEDRVKSLSGEIQAMRDANVSDMREMESRVSVLEAKK